MPLIHATTVAVDGRGVLIMGPSGAGKSSLGLQLIGLGAVLVADDQTDITAAPGAPIARAPGTIAGLIEARGVGLIELPYAGPTPVHLIIDLKQVEQKRLPDPHIHVIEGHAIPCFHNADSPHFAQAILLYTKSTLGK